MNNGWESLIDAARDLERGDDGKAILADLLTRFEACGASDQPGYAVAAFLRALLAAWPDEEDWLEGEGDDEA
jgi:hypothetical protein